MVSHWATEPPSANYKLCHPNWLGALTGHGMSILYYAGQMLWDQMTISATWYLCWTTDMASISIWHGMTASFIEIAKKLYKVLNWIKNPFWKSLTTLRTMRYLMIHNFLTNRIVLQPTRINWHSNILQGDLTITLRKSLVSQYQHIFHVILFVFGFSDIILNIARKNFIS